MTTIEDQAKLRRCRACQSAAGGSDNQADKHVSMEQGDLLNYLTEEIVSRKGDKPLKVGIDGRCAAGKTTIANELSKRLRSHGYSVLRPSVDGFHFPVEHRYRQGEYSAIGYFEDTYDYETIKTGLLLPLSGDIFPTTCRLVSFDHRLNLPVDSPSVVIDKHSVLLFEGIFIFRTEINYYWDYRILLSIDAVTSVSRALVRDTESVGTPDLIQRKYKERYEPAWIIYESRESPETKADVIIDNRDIASPVLLKTPARTKTPDLCHSSATLTGSVAQDQIC